MFYSYTQRDVYKEIKSSNLLGYTKASPENIQIQYNMGVTPFEDFENDLKT